MTLIQRRNNAVCPVGADFDFRHPEFSPLSRVRLSVRLSSSCQMTRVVARAVASPLSETEGPSMTRLL